MAAEGRDIGGWETGSIFAGIGGNLLGTGIAYVLAGSSAPQIPAMEVYEIRHKGNAYFTGYMTGYKEKIRDRRKGAALGGGLVGTAIAALLYIQLQLVD